MFDMREGNLGICGIPRVADYRGTDIFYPLRLLRPPAALLFPQERGYPRRRPDFAAGSGAGSRLCMPLFCHGIGFPSSYELAIHTFGLAQQLIRLQGDHPVHRIFTAAALAG